MFLAVSVSTNANGSASSNFPVTDEIATHSNNTFFVGDESIGITYDVCKVMVTVARGGRSASATASNNMGNCGAATSLALSTARRLLNMM